MGQITLQDVRKLFGPVDIIKDANLDIEDGSLVVSSVLPDGQDHPAAPDRRARNVTGGQIMIDGRNVVDVRQPRRPFDGVPATRSSAYERSRQHRVRPDHGRLARAESTARWRRRPRR